MTKQRRTSAQRAYAAAQPSKTDKTVGTKVVAPEGNSLSPEGMRDSLIHLLLLKIHFLETERKIQAASMLSLVEEARARGATWQEVGDAYGVSAQAAWQKYRPRAARDAGTGSPGEAQELPFD